MAYKPYSGLPDYVVDERGNRVYFADDSLIESARKENDAIAACVEILRQQDFGSRKRIVRYLASLENVRLWQI